MKHSGDDRVGIAVCDGFNEVIDVDLDDLAVDNVVVCVMTMCHINTLTHSLLVCEL